MWPEPAVTTRDNARIDTRYDAETDKATIGPAVTSERGVTYAFKGHAVSPKYGCKYNGIYNRKDTPVVLIVNSRYIHISKRTTRFLSFAGSFIRTVQSGSTFVPGQTYSIDDHLHFYEKHSATKTMPIYIASSCHEAETRGPM